MRTSGTWPRQSCWFWKPEQKLCRKIYNVGDSSENYTKKTIVEEILKQAPQGKVTYGNSPSNDVRNYRVNFDRITSELNFSITRRVPDGIRELNRLVCSGLLTDPDNPIYRNN